MGVLFLTIDVPVKVLGIINRPSYLSFTTMMPTRQFFLFFMLLGPNLARIYQTSLDTGQVPSDWRDAWIVPVFKKGDKLKAVNYRPVSLTSITCKLLEHIIHSNVMTHFD